jgi:protein-disulfide isomerase
MDVMIVAAVVASAFALMASMRARKSTLPSSPPARTLADWRQYYVSPYHIGRPEAALRLVVWTDYECPECRKFETQIALLRQQLGDSLYVAYHQFPAIRSHPQSLPAALVVECARIQNRFVEAHDALFDGSALNLNAPLPGVDRSAVRGCIDEPTTHRAVIADRNTGVAVDVQGTPTVLVGDSLFLGGMPAPLLLARLRAASRHL